MRLYSISSCYYICYTSKEGEIYDGIRYFPDYPKSIVMSLRNGGKKKCVGKHISWYPYDSTLTLNIISIFSRLMQPYMRLKSLSTILWNIYCLSSLELALLILTTTFLRDVYDIFNIFKL